MLEYLNYCFLYATINAADLLSADRYDSSTALLSERIEKMEQKLFKDGEFFIGCNYWASHAGTNMWHDWSIETIEKDFKLLSEQKIKYLRIFPLWSDFQPIKMLRTCRGEEKEISMGENFLPLTEAGQAGLDEVMLERFGVFCDLAQKYDLRLIVGLITGWMSGRLYVPELFEGVNVLTDARAIKWQIKFVKYMVKHFKKSLRYARGISATNVTVLARRKIRTVLIFGQVPSPWR